MSRNLPVGAFCLWRLSITTERRNHNKHYSEQGGFEELYTEIIYRGKLPSIIMAFLFYLICLRRIIAEGVTSTEILNDFRAQTLGDRRCQAHTGLRIYFYEPWREVLS